MLQKKINKKKIKFNTFGYDSRNHWWWITKGHKLYIRDEKANWNLDKLGGEG
jgi:hypothetical protein